MCVKELWIDLFDNSLEKYKNEDSNIRSLAMILHMFQLEFQKVSKSITELKHKNELLSNEVIFYEQKLSNAICSTCKKNVRSPLKVKVENTSTVASPKQNVGSKENIENFRNVTPPRGSKSNESLFANSSFEDTPFVTSPTLDRKSRVTRLNKSQNLNNLTLLTPMLKVEKVKKLKQSKLPLTFGVVSENKNTVFKNLFNKNENNDTDQTFCLMGENDINLSIKKEPESLLQDVTDVAQSIVKSPDNKKIKLDNSYDCLPLIVKKSPEFAYKREPMKKKADRMQLPGWACPDCEKYYTGMKLTEAELRERMDKCSKHRERFNPVRYTPEGFWDPDFSPTQNYSFAFDL